SSPRLVRPGPIAPFSLSFSSLPARRPSPPPVLPYTTLFRSFTSGVVTVGVDNTPPTSALTIVPGARPDLQYWNAASQTYYYNPAGSGDLTVSDAPADAGGSGVARVDFPALSATGFSGPAKSVSSAPYVSDTYAFTSANAAAPSFGATVTDSAGNQVTDSPSFVRDTSAPSAPTLSAPASLANG